ncbi:unnamed protein product, partial [marine sediment metagenome]
QIKILAEQIKRRIYNVSRHEEERISQKEPEKLAVINEDCKNAARHILEKANESGGNLKQEIINYTTECIRKQFMHIGDVAFTRFLSRAEDVRYKLDRFLMGYGDVRQQASSFDKVPEYEKEVRDIAAEEKRIIAEQKAAVMTSFTPEGEIQLQEIEEAKKTDDEAAEEAPEVEIETKEPSAGVVPEETAEIGVPKKAKPAKEKPELGVPVRARKSLKETIIDAGHYLVRFVSIAAVVGIAVAAFRWIFQHLGVNTVISMVTTTGSLVAGKGILASSIVMPLPLSILLIALSLTTFCI